MKIGVITNCFKKPLPECIQLAGSLGLSGVQIYATKGNFSPETLTQEQKLTYKKLLADNGLVVSALCADMGGFGFERAQDNPVRVEKTKRIVDLAVEFGANVITTHIGVIPEDKTDPTYSVMLDALTECGIYAKEKGVYLTVESFGSPYSITSYTSQIEWLMENVEELKFTFDIGNFYLNGQDIFWAYKKLANKSVHVHCKDYLTNPSVGSEEFSYTKISVPVGQGDAPTKEIVEGFLERGYDGYFTVEYLGVEGSLKVIKESAEFFKTLLK